MALAYLRLDDNAPGVFRFWADIGTNRFYQYRIGKSKTRRQGVDVLDEPIFASSLAENDKRTLFDSGFRFDVPANLLQHPARFIQLWSFKDESGKSPAFSKIIGVRPHYPDALPPNMLKNKYAMSASSQINNPECRSVSFAFGESKFSSAMWWQAILPVLKVAAPVVLPHVVSWLASKLPKSDQAQSGQPQQAAGGQEGSNLELSGIVQAVLAALQKGGANAPTAEQKSLSQSFSRTGNRAFSSGFSYKTIQQGQSEGRDPYSQTKALPGLLLPLLDSVFPKLFNQGPDLLSTAGDSGAKLLNAIRPESLDEKKETNAFISGLFAEMNKRAMMEDMLRHLQSQPPGTATGNLPALAGLTTGQSIGDSHISTAIKLRFKKDGNLAVNGKNKNVFLRTRAIKLWLLAEVPGMHPPARPIPKSMVRLRVKDMLTGKLLLEKQYKFKDVRLQAELELPLSEDDLQALPPNIDLIMSAKYSWVGKNGDVRHAEPVKCPLYLINGAFLKGVGEAEGASVALTDPLKYRNFWHKVWEGDSNGARRWEINFDSKYYTYYRYDADTNGRVETKIKAGSPVDSSDDRNTGLQGKLKSGLEISPVALNALLPEISPYPALSPDQLLALRTDDLSPLQNQVATYRIQMRGKKEDKGIVWVYPEISIHRMSIQRPAQINDNGQVLAASEETVHFPRISHIHFLGVKPNAGGGGSVNAGSVRLDGFDTIFDARVAMMPVELEPINKKM